MMRSLPLAIVPRRFDDGRGWFSETFNEGRLHDLGITRHFVQDNQSNSNQAGTVRGFHFQRPPSAQAKLIRVVHGKILDIAVDIRRGSPSFGRHVSLELSAENGRQLYIPEGFAHGFITLAPDVIVFYKVSRYYAPVDEGGFNWNDPEIAFPWPFDQALVTSAKRDNQFPRLSSFDSPFEYDGNPLTDLKIINVG
jgi:dTDP-4-dehydrorhamnose 3,5-epimerase